VNGDSQVLQASGKALVGQPWRLMTTTHLIAISAAVVITAACDVGPLPSDHKPRGYDTIKIDMPGCPVQLPPVVDRTGTTAESIAKHVQTNDLCDAVTALKEWIESTPVPPPALEPGAWQRVESIEVFRTDVTGSTPNGASYRLDVSADIPERPRLIGVALSKPGGQLRFYIVHRGGL
jgi:hypothetical protein